MSKRVLIVEDDPLLAEDIEGILTDHGHEVVGKARNGNKALQLLAELNPDLVLLDISLEGDMDGVMVAEEIRRTSGTPFVFLTSHSDKLTIDRVKRTQPAGFIIKPFTANSVISNVEIAMFKEPVNTTVHDEIFVRDGNLWVKVKFEQILYLQADGNYTLVFTTDKKFMLSHTLKVVEEKLPTNQFMRIHRSNVVRLGAIDTLSEHNVTIGGNELPIGRSYQQTLLNRINKV
jgi:DNA-binding LytR/AlgR family response regulator